MIVFDFSAIRAKIERREQIEAGDKPAAAAASGWSALAKAFAATKGGTVTINVQCGADSFIRSRAQIQRAFR